MNARPPQVAKLESATEEVRAMAAANEQRLRDEVVARKDEANARAKAEQEAQARAPAVHRVKPTASALQAAGAARARLSTDPPPSPPSSLPY